MDLVLGVSMAPTTVRMVLMEGENADGLTVEQDTFEVTGADEALTAGVCALDGSGTSSAADQVIAAIVGTRECAAEGGHQLLSAGVTWTDPTEVSPLREVLAAREIRGVMLVSPLLAAAALTQTVGYAIGYDHLAMLFVEPTSATLAVVEVSDGSIVDLHRQCVNISGPTDGAVAELAAMLAALDASASRADGVFLVGCGVDIVPIKPALEMVTALAVTAPEEPDMALARGAALASANAPLFASSTAALAYALDPGTGEVNPRALAPAYLDVCAVAEPGKNALAYSALLDEEGEEKPQRRKHFALVGSALAAVLAIGATGLAVSLASDVRPTAGQRPSPAQSVVTPARQAPVPQPPAQLPEPLVPTPAPPPIAAPAPTAAPVRAPATAAAPPVVQQPPPSAAPVAPLRRVPILRPRRYPQPTPQEVPGPAPASGPPAAQASPPAEPQVPARPPMTVYLHLPFVTVPIPINPPPPPPPPPPAPEPGP